MRRGDGEALGWLDVVLCMVLGRADILGIYIC